MKLLNSFLTVWALLCLVSQGVQAAEFVEINVSSENQAKIVGVRLSDVGRHLGNVVPDLKDLTEYLERNSDRWSNFTNGKIWNIFFQEFPKTNGYEHRLVLTALTESDEKFFVETFAIQYSDLEENKDFIRFQRSTPYNIDRYDWRADAYLAERTLVVSAMNADLKMVFPLGVGSFDINVLNQGVSLLTPRFERAWLDKRTAIGKRYKPRYFAGKPFIRIVTSENLKEGHTSIGFHAQPNLDKFIRAFDSHGCMRMQTDDLELFYRLLMNQSAQRIPVTVKYRSSGESDHPMMRINRPYKRVTNVGSRQEPMWTLDIDELVKVTKDWENFAPHEELKDQDGDHYHDIFDYAMAWRRAERRENHTEMCQEKYAFDASLYVFDESKYVLDLSRYEVNRSDYRVDPLDYQPTFDGTETERERQRAIEKAERKYQKALRKANKRYDRAVRQMSRDREDAIEDHRNQIQRDREALRSQAEQKKAELEKAKQECLDELKPDRSLQDQLYRWWVHG